jgi:hypothetical protein
MRFAGFTGARKNFFFLSFFLACISRHTSSWVFEKCCKIAAKSYSREFCFSFCKKKNARIPCRYGCATELCLGKPTDKWLTFLKRRVELLLYHNVRPVLVFDGGSLPMKAETNKVARERKCANNKCEAVARLFFVLQTLLTSF